MSDWDLTGSWPRAECRAQVTATLAAQGFTYKRKSDRALLYVRPLSADHVGHIRLNIGRSDIVISAHVYLAIVSLPVNQLQLRTINSISSGFPHRELSAGVRLDETMIRGGALLDCETWTRYVQWNFPPFPNNPSRPDQFLGELSRVARLLADENPTLEATLLQSRLGRINPYADPAAWAYLGKREAFENSVVEMTAAIEDHRRQVEQRNAELQASGARSVMVAASGPNLEFQDYCSALRAGWSAPRKS